MFKILRTIRSKTGHNNIFFSYLLLVGSGNFLKCRLESVIIFSEW